MTTIYLIRHGESENNVSGLMGQPNSPLSFRGNKQAWLASLKFKVNINYSAIYTSTYERAIQTGLFFRKRANLRFIMDPRLNERSFGVWERFCFAKLFKRGFEALPPLFRANLRLLNMETEIEAYNRFDNIFNEIIKKHKNKTVLVFTHSNIMRMFLIHSGLILGHQLPAGSIKNLGYIKIKVKDGLIKEAYYSTLK